jgi:hypothetical protein
LEVRRSGGLFSPRVERLFIGGRDKTSLLDGLAGQVDAVRAVLAAVSADVPVRGALCFVGTELPWFGSSSIAGIPLVGVAGSPSSSSRPVISPPTTVPPSLRTSRAASSPPDNGRLVGRP